MKISKIIAPILLSLPTLLISQPTFCGEKTYFPDDPTILALKDSLVENGVDTILVYRNWIHANEFHGYEKMVWRKDGKHFQILLDLESKGASYQSKSRGIENCDHPDWINFFFDQNLNSIRENPPRSPIKMSHDASHAVEISFGKNTYCYLMDGLTLAFNPEHLRVKWIILLADE